jgi:hypothetical protein
MYSRSVATITLLIITLTTMTTGVSYVNELDPQRALHNLKAWVQHNPKYAGLELKVDEYSDGTLMDEVTHIFFNYLHLPVTCKHFVS